MAQLLTRSLDTCNSPLKANLAGTIACALQVVTKLVMVQQVLEGTLGSIVLMDNDLVLQSDEDMLLKMALLATIHDGIKVGVVEVLSGLESFRLISDTFTLCSCTSHIAIKKQLLDLQFNHLDKTADLDSFQKDQKHGLLFHLSLPNLESFPFVNVACQLDLCMEQGDGVVKNNDLLRLAKNELKLFCNNQRPVPNCKTDKPAGTHDLSAPVSLQGPCYCCGAYIGKAVTAGLSSSCR
ncbi:uncharacterized protein VP01_4917g1 [Puccinia sorghi]|uniref:Uncharacterized protein n=1 Tax=Puccinia sorghi TaxID=27349 RepID=A0A0L6UM32_9BASI|nr:uncharacterized protein VP01_4917g1 [Puccinia sorghi]